MYVQLHAFPTYMCMRVHKYDDCPSVATRQCPPVLNDSLAIALEGDQQEADPCFSSVAQSICSYLSVF